MVGQGAQILAGGGSLDGGFTYLLRDMVDVDDIAVEILSHRALLFGGRGDLGVHIRDIGYGRSDTRENLRRHFEVDRFHIAHAAVAALADDGKLTGKDVARALKLYKIDPELPNPLLA